jgi:protein-disulfide isomerase
MRSDELVLLTPPVRLCDHAQGRENAPITLVEYGDYECPHCGRAHPIVKQLQRHLGAQLRIIFRNFPLTKIHQHAQHAAEAAEAAAAQGRFWEMHDALFRNQRALEDCSLARYAEAIGLDTERFRRELADHVHERRVREDVNGGVRSGVNGTPTFFINGVRYDGAWEFEVLVQALREVSDPTRQPPG